MTERHRPFTSTEIGDFEASLQRNQHPAFMRARVENASLVAGRRVLYQAGLNGAWRDGFIACRFAHLKKASLVRLIPEPRPDFAITLGGREFLYEATQADQPGRRMGREYRDVDDAYPDSDPPPRDDPYEAVAARAANAALMLETAANRKAAKALKGEYDRGWGLVIYLNLMEYGWFTPQVERAIRTATATAHGLFREVVVLWKDRMYHVGPRRLAA